MIVLLRRLRSAGSEKSIDIKLNKTAQQRLNRAASLGCVSAAERLKKVDKQSDGNTDFPAYSDTVYSDTPLTVTLLACPK